MIKKILIGLLVLIVLLVIGAQLFLQYGLTDSLRKYVLPAARDKLKVEVSLEKVSVNLLAGSFSMYGVNVANPPGFQEPDMVSLKRCGVKIGIPALLKGGIAEIQKAVVKDGIITIVRNKDGALNIQPLLGIKEKTEGGAPGLVEKPATPAEAKKTIQAIIKTLEIKTQVRYADYQLTEAPFKMGLDLQAKLRDVANYGNEEVLSGSLALQGLLLVEDKPCAFDVHGQMAPIVDPLRLSFDVSGSMQEVDLKVFKALVRKHGIEDGTVCGTATLLCRKGVFNPDKSMLRLTFNKIKLTEEERAKIPGGRFPESLKIVIPVKGTLEHPEIDFGGILEKTLLSPDVVESVLKGVLEDQGKTLDKTKSETMDKAASESAEGLKKATEAPKEKLLDVNKALKDVFSK